MKNMDILVIKLGGSIISDKQGIRPTLRTERIREILREVGRIRTRRPHLPIILLHGAGSFGHPLAFRYRLNGQPLTSHRLFGAARTITATRRLANLIAALAHTLGLPVIPIQASSVIDVEQSQPKLDFKTIVTILHHHGIPLLGGDVGIGRNRTIIVSADRLAVDIANRFRDPLIVLLSNVDGVFQSFPPHPADQPLRRISNRELKMLTSRTMRIQRHDVTGNMTGKLREIQKLRHGCAIIANGQRSNVLHRAIAREIGTVMKTTKRARHP